MIEQKTKSPYVDKRKIFKNCWYPTSSNIDKITVDKRTNKLSVRFKRNLAEYVYYDVEKSVWQKLTSVSYIKKFYGGSIGKAFSAMVLKDIEHVEVHKLVHKSTKR